MDWFGSVTSLCAVGGLSWLGSVTSFDSVVELDVTILVGTIVGLGMTLAVGTVMAVAVASRLAMNSASDGADGLPEPKKSMSVKAAQANAPPDAPSRVKR